MDGAIIPFQGDLFSVSLGDSCASGNGNDTAEKFPVKLMCSQFNIKATLECFFNNTAQDCGTFLL